MQWSRPSHRPPLRRPTLLLRACTIYALGGEWREPATEDKLCVPVQRQAHTRTRAYVCKPMRSPGEEIPRKAGCRRERTTKRLIQTQMAQKPMLRAELYARALRASRNVKGAEVWVGARCALRVGGAWASAGVEGTSPISFDYVKTRLSPCNRKCARCCKS